MDERASSEQPRSGDEPGADSTQPAPADEVVHNLMPAGVDEMEPGTVRWVNAVIADAVREATATNSRTRNEILRF